MKRQRLKALGEAPLEATYEFNPRIEQNQEILSLSDSEKKSDKRGRNRRRMLERLEKPAPQTDLRIKFNQEYFSAKAHQQAKEKEWKCKGEQSLWGSQSGKWSLTFLFSQLTGSLAQISSNTAMWPTYWVTKAWICFWLTAEGDAQQSILWCLWPLLTCTFTNYLF